MNKSKLIFSGSSHQALAKEICMFGQACLGKCHIAQFPDGEISIEIHEEVRGREVFVVQTLAMDPNRYLVELLLLIDALKRDAAKSIGVIIPYFGYCRQDRRNKPGVPISAKLMANLISSAGASRVITCDLHADQVEGFFEIPVEQLHCQQLLCEAVKKKNSDNCIVVAPDIGSIKVSEKVAKLLRVDFAIVNKKRMNAFEVEGTLIGDVKGKNVLIVDDLCSTGGTLIAAAELCRSLGARKIMVAVSHALLVANACTKIAASPIEEFYLTNSIDCSHLGSFNGFSVTSIAPLIAEACLKN